MTVNEQLQIPVAPSSLNPTRYTRGLTTAQPQLAYEDWSLDFYNDTQAINNMSNAVTGGISYPTVCLSASCRYCKTKCKGEGLKWLKGGKECHNECVSSQVADKKGYGSGSSEQIPQGSTPLAGVVAPTVEPKQGL